MTYWLRRCVKFGWPLAVLLAMATVALAAFAYLAADVWQRQAIPVDAVILNALFKMESPQLTSIALAVTSSGSYPFVPALALVLTALWWRHNRSDIYAMWIALIGGSLLNELLKSLFVRPRPTLHPWLTSASGWSFPSGHSTTAIAFYGVLAYLIGRRVKAPYCYLIYALGGLWILLVGLSRNYLGVHFPSDVVAAYAVTLPLVMAIIAFHRCAATPEHPIPATPVPAGGAAEPPAEA